jgi:hypothetical protein
MLTLHFAVAFDRRDQLVTTYETGAVLVVALRSFRS